LKFSPGVTRHVALQPKRDTLKWSSGPAKMDAPRQPGLLVMTLLAATWRFWYGSAKGDALGTDSHAPMLPWEVIWKC
jgi:hypothetical protein